MGIFSTQELSGVPQRLFPDNAVCTARTIPELAKKRGNYFFTDISFVHQIEVQLGQ
jgi:hypothetical protein